MRMVLSVEPKSLEHYFWSSHVAVLHLYVQVRVYHYPRSVNTGEV